MRSMVERILRQYGRDMNVARGQERFSSRGFFQSVTGKLERLSKAQPGPLGLESRKQFLLFLPVEPELQEDDVVTVEGKAYQVRTVQQVSGTGEGVYQWAMCVEMGGYHGQ